MVSGISGVGGSWAPHAMSGASMRAPPAQKMTNLFNQIDTGKTGSISKSQFLNAFQTMKPTAGFKAMGANAVWTALDSGNNGSVSKQSFVQGMTGLMSQLRGAVSSGI